MDDLRELDYQLAKLLGWRHVERDVWIPPDGVTPKHVPYYSHDPAACAEMDGEMDKLDYWAVVDRATGGQSRAVYYKPGKYRGGGKGLSDCGSDGATECEARTRAAVRALEGEK